MLKKVKDKAGNEILQTLVIIAVIGALAITICILVSNKLKATGKQSLEDVGNGLGEGVNEASKDRDMQFNGY